MKLPLCFCKSTAFWKHSKDLLHRNVGEQKIKGVSFVFFFSTSILVTSHLCADKHEYNLLKLKAKCLENRKLKDASSKAQWIKRSTQTSIWKQGNSGIQHMIPMSIRQILLCAFKKQYFIFVDFAREKMEFTENTKEAVCRTDVCAPK